MFPFTIYHAAATMTRRYILYASSESERMKWQDMLTQALQLRKFRQEGNKVRIDVIIELGCRGVA